MIPRCTKIVFARARAARPLTLSAVAQCRRVLLLSGGAGYCLFGIRGGGAHEAIKPINLYIYIIILIYKPQSTPDPTLIHDTWYYNCTEKHIKRVLYDVYTA